MNVRGDFSSSGRPIRIMSRREKNARVINYPGTRRVLYPRTLVSDIAIFVLKRDVKLQLTNPHTRGSPS